MAEAPGKTLKARNMKWLVMLAAFDAALIVGGAVQLAAGGGITPQLASKLLAPGLLPLVVLILVHVLPPSTKFALVYWRGTDGLPGASAFSKHGRADPRVDMTAIERQLKTLPSTSAEQNRTWFRLYREVQNAPAVEQAHQMALLFRDMAAISALLALGAGVVSVWLFRQPSAGVGIFAVLVVQYLIFVACGRSAGIRFVCNVLAEHSVAGPKSTSKRVSKS